MENPHTGHRDRLRQRFLKEGLDHFEDHQVLEFLLFQPLPRRDTNKIAHALLQRFGSLSAVFEADPRDLASVPQIGEKAALFLSIIPPLTRRYLHDRVNRTKKPLNDPIQTSKYLVPLMSGRTEEVFYVLCLDTQCRLLFPALISEGTVKDSLIHPRHVVETVLRHKASNVILAHNHPSGNLEPSPQDIHLTQLLIQTLEPIGINILDHIIVAEGKSISLAAAGLFTNKRALSKFAKKPQQIPAIHAHGESNPGATLAEPANPAPEQPHGSQEASESDESPYSVVPIP
ncbi:RadC family protein [Magnetococcales bacterium HHB-1]